MTILYIAIGVCAIAIAVYFIRLAMDGRRLRRKLHERRVEDAERAKMFAPEAMSKRAEEYRKMQKLRKEVGPIFNEEGYSNEDDDTATWPILPGVEP